MMRPASKSRITAVTEKFADINCRKYIGLYALVQHRPIYGPEPDVISVLHPEGGASVARITTCRPLRVDRSSR